MYDKYDADLAEQWKAKPPTGAGSRGPRGQQEGDLCTVDGSPGRLKEIDERVCVAFQTGSRAGPVVKVGRRFTTQRSAPFAVMASGTTRPTPTR